MQDLVDRNMVVVFLQSMATDLEDMARAEQLKAAANDDYMKGCGAAARSLMAAARAVEKLPGAEFETELGNMPGDRFTITEQGRQALEEVENGLQAD